MGGPGRSGGAARVRPPARAPAAPRLRGNCCYAPPRLTSSPSALAMQLEVGQTPVTMLQLPWQSAGLDDLQRPVWPVMLVGLAGVTLRQFC